LSTEERVKTSSMISKRPIGGQVAPKGDLCEKTATRKEDGNCWEMENDWFHT